ncbi:GntR family transcriptional regulator [Aquabacter sp. CN5-332]|uniref:GntR family transcriptional regulator n=1 Tax=Aquabacter sp. CN5-332 TaxID=3156608 RepID=UPI0032B59D4B
MSLSDLDFPEAPESREPVRRRRPAIHVAPITPGASYRTKVYDTLKGAILEMDIYSHSEEVRLEERQLAVKLGVSRTPIREAVTLLEHEGLVRAEPRRGVVVMRRTRREILEGLTLWAALEGMAARLCCTVASSAEIEGLQEKADACAWLRESETPSEYSEENLTFHRHLARLSRNSLIAGRLDALFLHLRGLSTVALSRTDHAERSVLEHGRIVEAIAARDHDRAEQLVRTHALGIERLIKVCGAHLR